MWGGITLAIFMVLAYLSWRKQSLALYFEGAFPFFGFSMPSAIRHGWRINGIKIPTGKMRMHPVLNRVV